MSWATVKEACRLAIASALSLEDYTGVDGVVGSVHKVEWVNKRGAVRYLSNDSAWVDLRLGAISIQGTDEIRYTFTQGATAALSTNIPSYVGRRLFSIQILIGVPSQEDSEEAVGALASNLRTRLRRLEILGALQAAGVALRSLGPTQPADYRDMNGHWVSASVTEIFLACTEIDTNAEDTGDYITSMEDTEGTLTGAVDDISIDAEVVVDPEYEVII